MNRVVVVLGVGRIDGDERQVAPVLAAFQRRRPRGFRFGDERAAEGVRNAVGVDRDQADRPFALERAEPLHDRAGRQAEPAVARHLDRDEIAVLGAAGAVARDGQFAAELFLVDRHQPSAAVGQAAKNAEHAMLGAVDELDDASAGFFFVGFLDAQQRAVADAGDFARPRAARGGDADDRRRAVRFLVPFGRPREQFAVAVAAGDVGEHDRRQAAGAMQPLSAPLDMSAFGEFAQHALERGAVGILGAERAARSRACRPCRCARG